MGGRKIMCSKRGLERQNKAWQCLFYEVRCGTVKTQRQNNNYH